VGRCQCRSCPLAIIQPIEAMKMILDTFQFGFGGVRRPLKADADLQQLGFIRPYFCSSSLRYRGSE
jgi:hypothetical protein